MTGRGTSERGRTLARNAGRRRHARGGVDAVSGRRSRMTRAAAGPAAAAVAVLFATTGRLGLSPIRTRSDSTSQRRRTRRWKKSRGTLRGRRASAAVRTPAGAARPRPARAASADDGAVLGGAARGWHATRRRRRRRWWLELRAAGARAARGRPRTTSPSTPRSQTRPEAAQTGVLLPKTRVLHLLWLGTASLLRARARLRTARVHASARRPASGLCTRGGPIAGRKTPR